MTVEPSDGPKSSERLLSGDPGPIDWWTEPRGTAFRWLQQNASPLAPVYRAAAMMAHDRNFPGRVCLVAHAVREIRNRLPEIVAGKLNRPRTDYVRLAARIEDAWAADGLPRAGSTSLSTESELSASGPARLEVSSELIGALGELLDGHNRVDETNAMKTGRLFQIVGGVVPPGYAVRAWRMASKWSEEHAHVSLSGVSEDDEESLLDWFLQFEEGLLVLANRSFENMDLLDEILDSANR